MSRMSGFSPLSQLLLQEEKLSLLLTGVLYIKNMVEDNLSH